MEDNSQEIQYCFPNNNLSCFKDIKPEVEYVILFIFISLASVFTVFLNLLVIISISHFKQLHTPTNLLILSLAVADLIVGLIVIPLMGIRFIESCWYFGETFCSLFLFTVFVVVSASLRNLVFISVDRYIAVSDPLRYTVRVTTDKYVKIFCVAKYQAKVVNSVTGVSRSQRKAGKTLGIVVAIFFMCWIPYYVVILIEGNESTESVELNVTCWILYMNSCMNPLIYALFYKWFRISAIHIVTLKIFKPSSEYFSLFPEDK
ncbi:trace amine-associated receptor 13c-like [Sinocyclocheilus rhinocerous]|uniref:trace amine-associated receptor 13c-like n=1 Tax=Sinocyclocheilus rhinocerous TaxID=307959 RepID=UPI0007BA48A3|nr:PREDICTED: trace amine-associated receptor 13c-like [Sinocyclocheilus rhinocerous]